MLRLDLARAGAVADEDWPSIGFLVARDLVAMAGTDNEGDGSRVFVYPVIRPESKLRKLLSTLIEMTAQIHRGDMKVESGDKAA